MIVNNICRMYLLHISKRSLHAEMRVTINLLRSVKKDFNLSDVKEVVKKQTYPNLYKLLQVALSIPISLSICKRLFFSMKRLKIGLDPPWHKIGFHFYLF